MIPITTNNSPFEGLVKVVVALVIIGALVGLALGATDALNFITNSAKARAQSNRDAIDLKYYAAVPASDTETRIAKNMVDTHMYEEKVRQEMNFTNAFRYTLLGGGALLALLPLLVYLVRKAKTASPQPPAGRDPWKDPQWRETKVRLARQQEALNRLAKRTGTDAGEPAEKRPAHPRPHITIHNN